MKPKAWLGRRLEPLGFARVPGKGGEFVRWKTPLLGQSLELSFSDQPAKQWYATISTIMRSPYVDADYVYILSEYLSKEGVVPQGETRFHGWSESDLDVMSACPLCPRYPFSTPFSAKLVAHNA